MRRAGTLAASVLHHLRRRRANDSKYQYQLDRVMAGKVTPSGLNLLKRMLEYDPEKRIKAEEALDHEYFKESPVVTTKCVPALAPGR